jgi:phosphatidylglycerophosphatase A
MNWATLIASGGGAGYAPNAPGTWGSLVGLALGALLVYFGHAPLLFGILVVSGFGVWAVQRAGGSGDPGWIVIDEVAGQMIAVFGLPHDSALGLVLAFALFRFFDITKLGPIGWADARHDAWGVMGDDWLAGGAALLGILVIRLIIPGAHS